MVGCGVVDNGGRASFGSLDKAGFDKDGTRGHGNGGNIGLGRDGVGSEGNGGIMVLGRDGILGNGNAGGGAAVTEGLDDQLDEGDGERRAVGGVGIFILDGILSGTEVVSGCGRNGIFGNGNGRNGILGNLNFGNLSFGNLSFGNEKVGSLMGMVGPEANIEGITTVGCGASATGSALSERR
ncbi:hypothetical protein FNV43_RR17491 [Rhamnella rubrinervis]|uniref:Uncharacterized protein n=1 Tax=Rhamnella rubrinervis TaxID=2594499 RepID=A0A8K0E2P2_9ROSA|nr:hypothetical protein FNV43_RR17491 [Rhamnella rubrinervis]